MEEQMKQKNSGLGITGLIMAIIPCTSFIGLILSIIDVCKKDGKKKTCAIIGIVISGLYILISLTSLAGARGDNNTVKNTNNSTIEEQRSETENKKETEESTEEEITYTSYTVSKMMADLDENALRAESKYNGQYIEVTGELSNIDSSGKYISLSPENGEFTFITNVTCYIQNDLQKEKIMDMSTGDIITIKGKVTSVGEVLGYSIDIDEIE